MVRLLHIPLEGPSYAIVMTEPRPENKWKLLQSMLAALAPWHPVTAEMRQDRQAAFILNLPTAGDLQKAFDTVVLHADMFEHMLAAPILVSTPTDNFYELPQRWSELVRARRLCPMGKRCMPIRSSEIQLRAFSLAEVREAADVMLHVIERFSDEERRRELC